MLGWKLETSQGMELDQFDRQDTVYVVALDRDGNVNGCARLLPTSRPYLLGDVFPQLLCNEELPCDDDVWELSRFAAVDFGSESGVALQQFSASFAIGLLKQIMAHVAELGAKRLITVSPLGIERLLRLAGVESHRAGPPVMIDGRPIFACWIELDDDGSCSFSLDAWKRSVLPV